MRAVGMLLVIGGVLGFLGGMLMDTSVPAGVGQRVHNIGLMRVQENLMLLAVGLFVGGAVLFGLGSRNRLIAEASSSPQPPTTTSVPASSIADEIRKLGELRDQGLLTQEEFQSQKEALMRGQSAATEQTGLCPDCNSTIPLNSIICPKCSASFGIGSYQQVKPL